MLMLPPAPPAVVSEDTVPPEMLTDVGAVTVTWPPWPPPEVPLSIRAPLAIVRVLRLRPMSPAVPAPTVFTELVEASLSVRVGVATLIRPALPVLSVVLKTPLAAPARDTDSPALTVTLPPAPPVGLVLVVLLWIWPPFVTLNVLSSVTT